MNTIKYNGQAEQDKFVCNILKHKTNGFFIEVGSNHPIKLNNTYVLESNLNWKGLMLEHSQEYWESLYKEHRPNSAYVFGDARQHNYEEVFNKHNVPQNIDYLQLDIEPPEQTLNVLKSFNEQVMGDYKFAVVTFEHDYAHEQNIIPRNESREILKNRGYFLVFGDICNQEPRWVYEDWYVHPDLVDMDYIKALQSKNYPQYSSGFGEVPSTLNWQDIIY